MNIIKLTAVVVFYGLCALPNQTIAQEKMKMVILSPKVGTTIDAIERDSYQLFPQIENFFSATLFQAGDTYFASVMSRDTNGRMRDTSIWYSENLLLMIAQKIEHYEDLKAGEYQMGDDLPILQLVEPDVITIARPPIPPATQSKIMTISKDTVSSGWSDILPFAQYKNIDEDYSNPRIGFSVGISTYSPDLGGINKAFTAIENKYYSQGYSIGRHDQDMYVSPLLCLNLQFRIYDRFQLQLATGNSMDSDEFRTISASILYSVQPFDISWFRTFAGMGVSRYHFEIVRKYGEGSRISEYGPNGSYTYLDDLTSKGSGWGYPFVFGIESRAGDILGMSIYAEYLFTSSETTTINGENFSVRLSSPIFGAKFSLYF